jgi:splicing factor 3A subunit 1
MPPPGIPEVNAKDDPNSLAESKNKSVGIIIPPPEIRKIADKTAEYVAKNGSGFEEIVKSSEASNPKFSFLKTNDPYRAYYEQKVIDFAKGLVAPDKEEEKSRAEPVNVAPIVQKKDIKKEIRKEVKPPPADKFTVTPLTNLTVLDTDIIRLTAQFVAKNGQKFLIALTEREKQNPQFDFLKPTHQQFSFFTNLVDAYSKCINPSRVDVTKLQQYANDKMAILTTAGERFDYDLQQSQAKKKKDEGDDEERAMMAQIEWNDFVIVETIDLFDDEELPAPSTFTKPEPKPIGPDRDMIKKPTEEQTQFFPSSMFPQVQPSQKPIETAAPEVKVKTDYVRKTTTTDTATNKCPICGQYIPISEFNEHLRIEMMDPRHKDVKQDVQARAQNVTMVSGDEIAKNLQAFARNMPSVFGSAEEQAAQFEGPKGGAPKVVWDGQSGTMTRTTANQAMIAQQQRKNYEEQLRAYQDLEQKQKKEEEAQKQANRIKMPTIQSTLGGQAGGKTTNPVGPQLPQDSAKNPSKVIHERQDIGGMEGTKKVRTEEANLIPEEMWLMMNPGSITINVSVPNFEEEGTYIESKLLQLPFDPKTTISAIKDHISNALGGLPASKMRLKTPHQSALKDENTLAFYNILNGTVMDLSLKERGGRNR